MEIKKWRVYLCTEPGKVRPVVVVQTDLLNGVHPSTVICPLTTRVRPQARILRVHLASGEAGLKHSSDVMVDQVRAIDNRRLLRSIGTIRRDSRAALARNLVFLLS